MSKTLVSFEVENLTKHNNIYVLLRQKNINCFKGGAVNADEDVHYYIYLDEKDLPTATEEVPALADYAFSTVTVNTKFILCNAVVGFDNIEDDFFKISPYHSGDSFDNYDEARNAFLEVVNKGTRNTSIVKALFDEDNRIYLNENYIVTAYFNLYSEEN